MSLHVFPQRVVKSVVSRNVSVLALTNDTHTPTTVAALESETMKDVAFNGRGPIAFVGRGL